MLYQQAHTLLTPPSTATHHYSSYSIECKSPLSPAKHQPQYEKEGPDDVTCLAHCKASSLTSGSLGESAWILQKLAYKLPIQLWPLWKRVQPSADPAFCL